MPARVMYVGYPLAEILIPSVEICGMGTGAFYGLVILKLF
jgi:hypothetical protein